MHGWVYMCPSVDAPQYSCAVDKMKESLLSLHHVGPGNQTQAVRFGSKCFYPLSHVVLASDSWSSFLSLPSAEMDHSLSLQLTELLMDSWVKSLFCEPSLVMNCQSSNHQTIMWSTFSLCNSYYTPHFLSFFTERSVCTPDSVYHVGADGRLLPAEPSCRPCEVFLCTSILSCNPA